MKILKLLFAVVTVALLFSQCKYDFIVPEETDPNETISFSSQVEPIFQSCTACHNTNGRSPDLTAGNAYSSLVPNYVNLDNPEASKIYTQPNPDNGGSHPKYSPSEAEKVLIWISQGAQNN